MHEVRNGDDPLLHGKLEASMPEPMVVGRGNALFVSGWCFHRERRIVDLAIRTNGNEYRIVAHSMPRADVFASWDRAGDPHGNRYRSGFWAILPFESSNGARAADLELVATLSSGETAAKHLATIELEPAPTGTGAVPVQVASRPDEPLIAICMT